MKYVVISAVVSKYHRSVVKTCGLRHITKHMVEIGNQRTT